MKKKKEKNEIKTITLRQCFAPEDGNLPVEEAFKSK
jgi:hypothetical protein